ncbi:MAG: DUF502 domain-containing protein [Methylococcales symbiont of Iophon sp. n. MRB-2018]|nr:MAG: DUF502 domain-containing protein [Methylococcales symbiont of Iophon sp. n. MRB-2018]KAF3979018.1 MAG: DUF502 domain-containing protein [Methylococcales symbiont of Iophon sp. n. MRB-2018]
MKKIFNYFLIGILAFIPVYVIGQIVFFVNDRFTDLVKVVYGYNDNYIITFIIFVISFSLFSYIGYRVRMGKSSIISAIDAIIEVIPFLNTVYRVTKKLVNMASGHGQTEAREVVYIEYPKEGLWVPAYVTNKTQDMYILFVPTSPNPTSGFTVIVHKSKVIKSAMDIEQATSFIISVGVDYDRVEEATKLPK